MISSAQHTDGGTGLGLARDALDAVQRDPHEAMAIARSLIEGPGSAETIATALWALGLAHRELNQLSEAGRLLVQAIDVAAADGLAEVAAGARTSRALVLAYLGEPQAGLAELELAEPALAGAALARLHVQRSLILQRLGRLDEAIAGYGRALPGLQADGDTLGEVRLLTNRGIALTYRNRLEAADADLSRARDLAQAMGRPMVVASCSHNLGFLHGRRGDIPQSLSWFAQAARDYEGLDLTASFRAVLLADEAEVLLDAGLIPEALARSGEAVRTLTGTDNAVDLAEARVSVARASQAAGDHEQAVRQAALARAAFTDQDRVGWADLAHYLELISLDAQDRLGIDDIAELRQLVQRLDSAGWSIEASSTRVIIGRILLAADDRGAAAAELALAASARRTGSAVNRMTGWYAETLQRDAVGDRRGARRAAQAGLDLIDRHRATLAASDLRAHAARHGTRLAEYLLAMAVEERRPHRIFAAAERFRSAAWTVPAKPPPDADLAALLSELRAHVAERRVRQIPEPDLELARLERRVRDHVRQQRSSADRADLGSRGGRLVDDAEIRRRLGDRMVLEWFVHRGDLMVISIVDGRIACTDLGSAQSLPIEVGLLRKMLNRLARGGGSARSRANAADAMRDVASRIGAAVFGPLAPLAGERELVLVPTGVLHLIPWAALDVVRSAPFAVAPSARVWYAADHSDQDRGGLLAVAGPGLPGARTEIDLLRREIPGVQGLVDDQARVDRVMAALSNVGTAHVAAHGRYRADNPQFSSIALADGDLTVYDLETLSRVPRTVVLAACDAGDAQVNAGDELMGFAAALLRLGASSVVAASVAVPDDLVSPLMVDLQVRLRGGDRVPEAVFGAVGAAMESADPRLTAAAASFVTIGS